MAHRPLIVAATAAVLLALAGTAPAAPREPWQAAADVRTTLAEAQRALVLGEPAKAKALVAKAAAFELGLLEPAARPGLREAGRAVAAGDPVAMEVARAATWTAILAEALERATAAASAGDVDEARAWLLVREFRKPTRFTRPGADATLALQALEGGRMGPKPAAAAVRADLLDTYQARLRSALDTVVASGGQGFDISRAGAAALARGYFATLVEAYEKQRNASDAASATRELESLVAAAEAGDDAAVEAELAEIEGAIEGFRAAPLSEEEELRRAGQLQRFLALVPIEYGRGVKDGRVTLDFEIQEAVTFRDGAAQAFGDLEHLLALENQEDTRRLGELLDGLAADLGAAARHEEVADPDDVQGATDEALDLIESLYPDEWEEAGATADFDVIAATLDRLESAIAAGQFSQAEQARLEAYAFFEFGPEQRLRGLANDLFVEVEGLFWYGSDGLPGLAQLVKRKAEPEEVAETRKALDLALADAEAAVGAGPTSNTAVISNTAIIVFREGLEAVLILAALMAGMVGAQAGLRKPLLLGAAAAFVATVATWGIAQTVLGSLSRYGEKLEAMVSLVAIGVLLLILNWFYHRVYWGEHLAGLHSRKKKIIGIGVGAVLAQIVGLVMLGFTSVYREGFETVLFLQAIVLEAGAGIVLIGVAIGLAATLAVGYLTIRLQRKLPHKKMLVATGLLILWVLVIMVGTTVQTLQVVGWIPVTPVEGLRLPYWAGLWLGVFPTWEGLLAQGAAVVFVLGSYVLAEQLRARRRRAILDRPLTETSS
ncbi:MAG TPA: FTR1 family protein [Gaiellaceae bacterium]|nr:FTR1 family protein [Gaiellaceae bacterium]